MAFNFIKELKNIRGHLLMQIAQERDIDSFFAEDPSIVSKRKYHYDILKLLEKSEKIMLADEE